MYVDYEIRRFLHNTLRSLLNAHGILFKILSPYSMASCAMLIYVYDVGYYVIRPITALTSYY